MRADAATNGAIYEKTLIDSGLKKLGIEGRCQIVIADVPDVVEETAAQELKAFLHRGGVTAGIVPESGSTGKIRFLLGRESKHKGIKKLGDNGELKIRDVSPEDDGFHLKRIGDDFVLAGANPRGVLYAVYAFEDFVRTEVDSKLDIRKVPYYRKRGSGSYYSFNVYVNIFTEDFPEEKAAYLARMGINQLTDQGIGYGLYEFVRSDVFPFQIPPRADYQRKVKAMSALCRKYGIDQYLFVTEPILAAKAGDLSKYPEEALGTVDRPWGSPKKDRTLCVHSPIVQEYLRNMMKKLVREYPDIKGMLFYNMDGSAWLCTPELCDRCKITCKDSPRNEYNPWETQARLVTLLAEAAHEENPDFDFRFWGTAHYHGERFDKMIHAAQGYSSMLSCWNAADREVMVADAAKLDPAFVISQKICNERGIPLYMLSEFNNIEQVPRSLPFPFHVCDALKKYKQWGVRYLTEIFGLLPEHNSINSLVMREFQWNPDRNPEEFLSSLSVIQFGETCGKLMCRVWEEMEKAFDVWNAVPDGLTPLSGSQHQLSIGTPVNLPPPILPEIVKSYNYRMEILTNVETWRATGYQEFKEKALLDSMNMMNAHLSRAADLAKKVIAAASDREFIGICHYEGLNGRPTRREYAELNYAPIAIANALCRQRCNMLRAYHLLTGIENARIAGDEKACRADGELYFELVREDIGVQEAFHELLTSFATMRPCYMRTSMTEHEISILMSVTQTKTETLKKFLETGRLPDGGVRQHEA